MSVVAGCSLFNGVILVADCRATVECAGKPPLYIDNVQKLFALARTTALGFVGDIGTAARLLRNLPRAIEGRRKRGSLSAVGLLNWLPRYFRRVYKCLAAKIPGPVVFMVASIIPGRPNTIERARVVALMERFRLRQLSHERHWLPGILVEILRTPAEVRHIGLADVPAGLMYVMRSPEFEAQMFEPLQCAAVGSGDLVVTELDREADWIFAGDVGNPYVEAMAVRQCVSGFIREQRIESVGGLFPLVRVDGSGVRRFGHRVEIPVGGEEIELRPDPDGRWTQIHVNSGTEQRILYPWEIDFTKYSESQTFDFLKEAEEKFRGSTGEGNVNG